jgi:hypothetical protein
MSHSQAKNADLQGEVARLTNVVNELKGRLDDLQGQALPSGTASVAAANREANGEAGKPRSRRDLLKLAGAAAAGAAGAAGAVALRAVPASANSGDFMFVGLVNSESSTTDLLPTAAATGAFPMLRTTQKGATTLALHNGSMEALGGPDAEGIDAWCSGTVGWAVNGQTDSGIGIRGQAATGIDVAAHGTGRISQAANIAAGPPTFATGSGEMVRDSNGVLWISGVGINGAGNWAPVQPGSLGGSLFTAVSNQQYTLQNSDGVTWVDMDAANLSLTITPRFNAVAILYANADLWTTAAGDNQDIGIAVGAGTVAPTIHSWHESGGFAGTFSPNAAFVHGVYGYFVKGTTYTVKIQWKTNHAQTAGHVIVAGAGAGAPFSPTRLSVQLVIV